MPSLSIISKLTGVTNKVEASEITLNSPSIVELKAERADIASITRTHQDMVITLRDGEINTVKNFYAFSEQGGSQLVLEGNDGVLWWVQDTETGFHFEHIANIDELMAATGAHEGGGAVWPWVLGGLAIAGGIGIAAASGGGGGGGGGSDDNANGGGNNGGSNNGNNGGNGSGNPGEGGNTGGPGTSNPGGSTNADTLPPTAPTNLAVSADGRTVTGTAEPGSTVTIKDASGNVIGTGTAGSDGSFTIPVTTPQINGETLNVSATDPAGNTGPSGTVTAPLIPEPLEPVLTGISDDTAPVTGAVLNGESTNDQTPTIQGFALAGSTLHIYDNGVEIGTTVANANGSWAFTPGTALADGTHAFTATATNPKGTSGESSSFTVVIDTVAPDAPVLNQINDDVQGLTGPITGSVPTNDTQPTFSGTGEPKSTVTLMENGVELGRATVDANGNWTITPALPLPEGSHSLTIQQTDPAGNGSSVTAIPPFTIDLTPPAAAAVTEISLDGTTIGGTAEANSHITIKDADGVVIGSAVTSASGSFVVNIVPAQTHGEQLTVAIQDGAGNSGPSTDFTASVSGVPTVPILLTVTDDVGTITGALSSGQATDDATPELKGTAEANSGIIVYNNGVEIGTTTADGSGNWTFIPTVPLTDGTYSFTISATNTSGESGKSPIFTLSVDTVAPATPIVLDVTANGLTVTGTAEAGSLVTIKDGNGNTLGTATANDNGSFTAAISPAQTNGEALTATATDSAGNASGVASFNALDNTAPAAPTGLQVSLDGNHVTGTAEPGSTVIVKDGDGNILGSVQADPVTGAFDVTPLTPPQTNGEVLTVNAEDAAGNPSPDGNVVAQDTTTPDAPTGLQVNGDGTIVTGNAEAGSTVTVKDGNGTVLGEARAEDNGTFSVPVYPAQTNGQTLDVTATDSAGHTSLPAETEAPDTTAPAVPVISSVVDNVDFVTGNLTSGQLTNDDKPTLTGTAEGNAVVKIYDNGGLIATIQTDGTGAWTFTPTAALTQGTHLLTVTASDAHGNTSPASSFTVVVDSIAPLAATITQVSDDANPITGTIANNGVTNDASPTISGTAEPGSFVNLYDNGSLVTTFQVGTTGTWSYTKPGTTSDGIHRYTVTASDSAGNTTAPSAAWNITVDTSTPGTPVITEILDNVGSVTTPLSSNGFTDDTQPQLRGTGTIGSTITLYDGTTPVGTAIVDGSGNWTITPVQPLSEGAHALSVIATTAAGNASSASNINLTVDTTPPPAPSILTAAGDIGGLPATLNSGGSTQTTRPELSGKGEPGAKIEIFDNGGSLGTATVQPDGNWTFTTPVLSEGPHSLTAVATDPAGNVGQASPGFTLTVDNTPPAQPAVPVVVDDQAPGLGNIAANGSTNDTTPTFTGTGTAGDTVAIFNGTDPDPLGTATVRADGSWSFTPGTPLPQGQYTIHVVETDPAGNSSLPSGNIIFTVDTTAPGAPVILNADDDVGAVTTPLTNGSVTDDSTPVFHGTGNQGDTITLYNGATVVGTAVVGAGGLWTLTPTAPLPNGTLNLTATATDPAGNTGLASGSFTLTVNSTPLTLPVVSEIVDNEGVIQTPLTNGSFTDDTSPTLNGTGTVGSTVTVYDTDGTTALGSAIVGADGTWSITTSALGEGAHNLTVRATDAAGNAVGPTAPVTLNVDTTDPAAPTGVVISGDGTVVTGNAEANSTVIIRDADGNEIGRGVANGSGAFSVTVAPAQTHEEALTATAQDRAGNQSPDTDFNGSNSGLPPAPVIINALDDVGTITTPVTNGKSTDDTTPTLTGTAVANATVTLYQDGVLLTTVTADSTGAWTYPITTELSEGTYNFTVSQTVGGLTSGQSPNFTLTVDTTAPVTPFITSVIDDVAPHTGNVDTGQPTNDARPTFNGTGEAGSTITLLNNGLLLGTTIVNAGGTWSFTPAGNMSEGSHNITFSSADAAGNSTAGGNGFELIVDTLIPTAPVITGAINDSGTGQIAILSGQPTGDATPTINGTAEANSQVTISDNGNVIGTASVDGLGNWNFTPATPLGEGSHSLTVTATDGANNVSPPSNAFNVVVDTAAPVVPAITQVLDDQTITGTNTPLTNGQLTKDSQPTLNGTSEANAIITIKDGNTVLGTATANASGAWTFTPGTALGQGSHTLTVTATDAAGNVSNPSSSFSVVIDSVAPNAPTIVTVTDNTAPSIGPITSGAPTNETRPAITGTGEVGATITVYDGSTALGTTTVGAGGSWSFTPAAPLGTGSHLLTVTATDTAGNVSAPSGSFNVVVDTAAPVAPAITIVADDVGTLTGNLTSGQVTDDSRPALSGTAEANATVTVYDNGSAIGTAQANGSGAWTFTPPVGTPLANGSHTFTVTASDAAGNVSPAGGSFTIIVDTVAPTSPVVIEAFDDVGPNTGSLVSGQTTNDKQPLLSGTAEANSVVTLYDNGTLLGTANVSAAGTWVFTPGTALGEGTHVFTAYSTDAAGNVGAISGTFTLIVDSIAPTLPVLVSVVDDIAGGVFNNPLANGQATNDARPTLNGTGETGSIISVYDGSTLLGTTTVVNGNWSFTPGTPLSAGSHTLSAIATDAAGNASAATAGFTVVVDTAAPAQPAITSIIDDVGTITGTVANNQPTNDARPTLNGTAEAGATVSIYDNGTLLTTVTASGSGSWTYTPAVPLAQGNHSFTVSATDAAGNTSTASLPSAIVVDTTPPGAPTGMTVNGTGTTVTGTAEAGSTVTITSSAGTVLGTATADGTGAFSVTITPAQTSGQPLLIFATDPAGNLGVSAGFTAPFTGVPGVPIISSVVDDTNPQTGTVGNGQSTNDTTPTLNGTAQAGATVNVYNNGVLMGTTTANGSGNWSYTPTGNLSEGSHAFTATATNTNGTGSPSAAATVIVDTIAPGIPTAIVSADGTTVSGTAEANSTVTITLPGGVTVTATANGSGAYSVGLPSRQIDGETLSVKATDAAGNASPTLTVTAPDLPLAASSNVVDLALTTDAQTTTAHYSDYGTLLVGALGNVASVLGNDTAQVGFTIADGGTGNITIDATATGVVLSLLNTLEVAIQKYDSATGTWSTIIDSSSPQFANLLTLGASGVTLNVTGLGGGSYRVLSYNTSLLATGSLTSLDVSVVQTTAGTITGGGTHPGNVITDIDPNGGQDTAPAGTVVSSVTNSQGVVTAVGAGGADIQGLYGTLHINQNGSYTYTLTNTSASVLGRTENFTYTLSQGGVNASAQLVVTLGNGAPASTVTATDNTAALTYSTDVEAVNHGASQQNGLSVLSVGAGNVLSLNVLANMANPIIFDVEEGSTRTMTLQASVGGVALLSTFDLYIYKFNDITQQFEQYKVEKTWLTAPLLGGSSGQLTLTLPGGEYLFLLNNASGVSVLTGYTLNILQDHTYAVDSVTATTTGNVMQDDIVPAGSHVTQVNGVSVAGSGTTVINGQYGTLTIDANGNYTYRLNAGVGADSIKTPDSFVYTVRAPNGDTDTASLNVTATPNTVNAIDDTSALMSVATAQNTADYSDTTVGSAVWNAALLSSTSGSGSGTFVVDSNNVLHNPVLHFTVQSLLSLGGLNVNWSIVNGSGTVVKTGSFGGGLLLGGVANVDLSGLDLQSGTWTLNYTGNMGPLAAGQIRITPTVTGTTLDLDSYSTLSGSTVHGNLYDGSDAAGAVDQLGSVHTLLTVTGFNGSTATLNPLTNSSASATIQGHYGTLQIGIDGSYTYTLNSGVSPASITSKETFTYSLNDRNGHTDSATLTINMNPQFVSTAQSDVISGSVYGDTLVYHLLNSTNATGGNGADTWSNFSLAQGDKIDVHDLLTGWNGQASTLGNYLNVTTSGNNTVISIDRDGAGATWHSTTLVTLENTHTTLDELVQQNHIVT